MTVGAVINVKDDVELLETNLHYHKKIGVDYFLLCDRGSTDESRSRINKIAQDEGISVFEQNIYNLDTNSEAFINRRTIAFHKIVDAFAPDWVLVMDTDEFWIPRSGNIRATQNLENFDMLSVPRFNAALMPQTVSTLFEKIEDVYNLTELEIIVEPMQLSLKKMKENPHLPWIMHKIRPKLMTNIKDIIDIKPGFHDLQSNSMIRRSTPNDLLIIHIPFTTEDRFKKKVNNIRIHLEQIGHTFDPDQAWHWKRWGAERDTKTMQLEFKKQFFSSAQLQVYKRSNVVMSIREYFEKHT